MLDLTSSRSPSVIWRLRLDRTVWRSFGQPYACSIFEYSIRLVHRGAECGVSGFSHVLWFLPGGDAHLAPASGAGRTSPGPAGPPARAPLVPRTGARPLARSPVAPRSPASGSPVG